MLELVSGFIPAASHSAVNPCSAIESRDLVPRCPSWTPRLHLNILSTPVFIDLPDILLTFTHCSGASVGVYNGAAGVAGFEMQPLCVFTGRLKGSGIVLHPPLPPHPLHPPILLISKAKSSWERGWITRRRATRSLVILPRISVALQTEAPEILRAITPSEEEAADL